MHHKTRPTSFSLAGPAAWLPGQFPSWRSFGGPSGVAPLALSPAWAADFAGGSYMRLGEESTLAGVLATVRSGSALEWGAGGTFSSFGADAPVLLPERGLGIRGQSTNLFSRSNTVSGWTNPTIPVATNVSSCLPEETARKYRNTGAPGTARCEQDVSVAAGMHVLSTIVENVDAADFSFGYGTTGSHIVLVKFTWATGLLTVEEGTVAASRVTDLGTGPNGGALIRADLLISNAAATTRRFRNFYAGRDSLNLKASIVHYMGLVAGATWPPVVVSGASPGTRFATEHTIPGFGDIVSAAGLQAGFSGSVEIDLDRLSAPAVRVLAAFGADADNCLKLQIDTDDRVRLVARREGVDEVSLATSSGFSTTGTKTIGFTAKPGAYSLTATGIGSAASDDGAALPDLAAADPSVGSLWNMQHLQGTMKRMILERMAS